MTSKRRRKKANEPLSMWDADQYFDATFTEKERSVLRRRLMQVCGYGPETCSFGGNFVGFDYDIERPAQDSIAAVFTAQGLCYRRDYARFADYGLIHICRELGIDHRSYAANVPKRSIDKFVEFAKRSFPEFKRPRNKIERKIQEHKLHAAWCDWSKEECPRTGCTSDDHWLCSDRFVDRDYAAIIEQVAVYNETRPKFAPPKLVYSRD